MENFAQQWFTAYYLTLGTLLVSYGLYLIAKRYEMAEYLFDRAGHSEPPRMFRSILKYFLLFTLPGLALSFFPFSWVELLFSIWCLIIIFTAGQLLVQWPAVGAQIRGMGDELPKRIRFVGFNFISIGIVVYLLCYLLLTGAE